MTSSDDGHPRTLTCELCGQDFVRVRPTFWDDEVCPICSDRIAT